jgi:hypothetical protein
VTDDGMGHNWPLPYRGEGLWLDPRSQDCLLAQPLRDGLRRVEGKGHVVDGDGAFEVAGPLAPDPLATHRAISSNIGPNSVLAEGQAQLWSRRLTIGGMSW